MTGVACRACGSLDVEQVPVFVQIARVSDRSGVLYRTTGLHCSACGECWHPNVWDVLAKAPT